MSQHLIRFKIECFAHDTDSFPVLVVEYDNYETSMAHCVPYNTDNGKPLFGMARDIPVSEVESFVKDYMRRNFSHTLLENRSLDDDPEGGI